MNLRARIALLVAAVVAGSALAGTIAVRVVAESRFRTLVRDTDRARALTLAPVLESLYEEVGSWDGAQQVVVSLVGMRGNAGGHRERMPQMTRAAMAAPGSRIVVTDARGLVVVDSDEALLGTRTTGRAADGIPLVVRGAVVGQAYIGTMIDRGLAPADSAFLASVTRAIVVATALAALAAMAVGLLVADRITRPVRDLTRAAERAASGDLDVRVSSGGGGEIGRLAGAFNAMTVSLREQVEGRKRLIADSAHELRTPASLIQGTVEAMLDGVYATDRATLEGLHQETVRLSRLVADLGELSLLDAGRLTLDLADTDLGRLARMETARFAERARVAGVELTTRAEPGEYQARVDAARIGQVVANLLTNALRVTPRGGSVVVTVGYAGAGGVELRVEDTGPGIPVSERERVFERYYRLDDARATATGGRGLGLAIASAIVRAHGGTLRATESALGGACLTLNLPSVAVRSPKG